MALLDTLDGDPDLEACEADEESGDEHDFDEARVA